MPFLRIVVIASVLAGCVGDELELGEAESEVFAKSQPGEGGDECPPWACGSNSPVIDLVFHDLSLVFNVPNLQGYKITGFQKFTGFWEPMKPGVVKGELTATTSSGNVLSGTQLAGSAFTIQNGSSTYYLMVNSVSRIPLWAKVGGIIRTTPTYRFTWSTVLSFAGAGTNLCGANNENDGVPDFDAVLFESDRIDADAIRVTGEDPRWFNIGCAGHTLAKQHLSGNTKAAAALLGVVAPTLHQRTANLKMLSADYCGGGDPFTVAGVPLHYKDSLGRMNNLSGYTHIEARWDETGAICLSTPRVNYTPTPMGAQVFPAGVNWLLDLVVSPPPWWAPSAQDKIWCTGIDGVKTRPPTCTNASLSAFEGGYVISVEE
ncbi:MAG: ADYC domain-containing protein [Polyangiales bacterium]